MKIKSTFVNVRSMNKAIVPITRVTSLTKSMTNLLQAASAMRKRLYRKLNSATSRKDHNLYLTQLKLLERKYNRLLMPRMEQIAYNVKRENKFPKVLTDRVFREKAISALQQKGEHTIMILDIDYFKRFNDDYGHPVGDVILGFYAKKLKKYTKDFAGRHGGEEFAAHFFATPQEAKEILLKMSREMQREFKKRNPRIKIAKFPTFSAGLIDAKGLSYGKAMELADKLLYRAKRAGRAGICYRARGKDYFKKLPRASFEQRP